MKYFSKKQFFFSAVFLFLFLCLPEYSLALTSKECSTLNGQKFPSNATCPSALPNTSGPLAAPYYTYQCCLKDPISETQKNCYNSSDEVIACSTATSAISDSDCGTSFGGIAVSNTSACPDSNPYLIAPISSATGTTFNCCGSRTTPVVPSQVQQAGPKATPETPATNPSFNYTLLEKIPGVDGTNLNLAAYLSAIYKLAIWIVGLCALFMFLIGAFMYMLSAANTSKMGSAKEIMQDALIGLVLALTSYLILYVINPDLVNLKLPTVSMPSTSSTPSGGAPTSVTPPAGTYSHTEAVQALSSKGIGTSSSGNCSDQNNKSCTSLDGIPKATIEDIIRLKEGTKCPVTVTGGTEVGHKSHGTGLPVVDLSENTCLEQYFSQNKPVGYDVTKICADGTSQAASYNCGSYVEAQAHFHIQFNT
ncbi:MAG: hypothetical protein QG581_391 [Patescibacteria group bacterium]|nr:hypothetical protein [Patescibacteria group bacterium]